LLCIIFYPTNIIHTNFFNPVATHGHIPIFIGGRIGSDIDSGFGSGYKQYPHFSIADLLCRLN
jgi:hypothetical protein